eukprot:NODE_7120_length_460_cov_194.017284.p2 GENE.NODE_7120_length_460_cov_194.017284~~NODE_7120_length_460_cov_194.017284.p2  ORF type:complete len:55 (+),score=24.43 NODE_7120_length_460_cov_194.017284:3-167(+)
MGGWLEDAGAINAAAGLYDASYELEFEDAASEEMRMLLLAAMIFLDIRYFHRDT